MRCLSRHGLQRPRDRVMGKEWGMGQAHQQALLQQTSAERQGAGTRRAVARLEDHP